MSCKGENTLLVFILLVLFVAAIFIAMIVVSIALEPPQEPLKLIYSMVLKIGAGGMGPLVFALLYNLPPVMFHIAFYVGGSICCLSTFFLSKILKASSSNMNNAYVPASQRRSIPFVFVVTFLFAFYGGIIPLIVLMFKDFPVAFVGILGLCVGIALFMLLRGAQAGSTYRLRSLWVPPLITFLTIAMTWEYINYVRQLHP